MRTEEENVYRALITLDLILFITCHLVSILHLLFETAKHVSLAARGEGLETCLGDFARIQKYP
jgi:hypothetical protein